MPKESVPITGVWVHRNFDHLNGELEVMVEIDGKWRSIQKHPPEGYISHITETRGMLAAPLADVESYKLHGD